MCMNLGSTTLQRVHSGISDFKPQNGVESGEAALRGLLARRAGVLRCVDSVSLLAVKGFIGDLKKDTSAGFG